MVFEFRLATFNVENLHWAAAREDEFKRRIAALRPILLELDPDILCLQEINAQKTTTHAAREFFALDRLLADTPFEHYNRVTSTRPGSDLPADVHNLAILSRLPILERRQVHHDIIAKWRWAPPQESDMHMASVEITFDRPILYAKIASPTGPPLHVVNLHLRASRPTPIPGVSTHGRAVAEGQFLSAQKREGQALEARLFVERLFDREPEARIAVCGDFNANEHDAPIRILSGDCEEDARFLRALELRVPLEQRFSVIHAGKPTLIDHILTSPTLAGACVDVSILNQNLQDEVFAREPIDGSLHAPVSAFFRFATGQLAEPEG